MTTIDDQRYDIFFAGECLAGHEPAAVRSALGKLFKADEATLQRLFSGSRQRIKKDCDKASALKYQKAMKSAGARVIVVSAGAGPNTVADRAAGAASATTATLANEAARAASSATAAAAASEAQSEPPRGLSLEPPGSDVLRPEERPEPAESHIDLSHLSVAETGERLSPAPAAPANVVAAPELELAEVGSTLSATASTAHVETPDTSSLTLAPLEHDLSDCRATVPPISAPSIAHLELGEVGSDLLPADQRQTQHQTVPDISHISLEELTDSNV